MKVLLLAENWPPRVGGIERYLVGLFTHLDADRKFAVVPLADGRQGNRKWKIENGYAGLSVIRKRFFVPFLKPRWLLLFWHVRRLVKQEGIDVLICGKALFEGLLGYYLKKSLGLPYVVCTYAMEIEAWAQPSPRQLAGLWRARTFKKLIKVLRGAHRVVYINYVTKQRLIELGVTEKQLVKIQPGVDEEFFRDETAVRLHTGASHNAADTLKKYGVQKPYVLSVGRLIARKGFDDVIRAFGSIDQVKHGKVQLVIAGDGPEREHLDQVARNEMAAPLWLSGVPDEDLLDLYAGAELFILLPKEVEVPTSPSGLPPSARGFGVAKRGAKDYEGFGIVYLEAGAAGVPVIGTRSGGAPEAIVGPSTLATGILVAPGSPDEAAQAIEYLLEHPAEARRMGEMGKQRAREEFSWEKQAEKLKSALNSVVK